MLEHSDYLQEQLDAYKGKQINNFLPQLLYSEYISWPMQDSMITIHRHDNHTSSCCPVWAIQLLVVYPSNKQHYGSYIM